MIAAIVDHLWQSTACALAICVWLHVWRGGFASVRHGFLMLASLKFVVPLALLYAWGVHRGYPMRYPEELPPSTIVAAVDASQPVFWPAAYLPGVAGGSIWATLLAAAWGAGALFFGARALAAWRAERITARDATPLPAEQSFDSALEVRVSTVVAVPSVVGVVRPVLLLPAGAESKLDDAQRAAVFAYAKEYARRRYYAQAQLQRLVEAVCWFHPLVWWTGRELPREAARACDQRVIAADFEPAAYANGLLAAASLRHPPDVDWVRRGALLPTDAPPRPLGFLRGMAVSACAWIVVMQPLFAGKVHDRLHRHAVLVADIRSLRGARIEMAVAAPGMGDRIYVAPDRDGVFIRNASIRDLLALSNGVHRSDVIASQMKSSFTDDQPPEKHWMYFPRWDVRVTGRLTEPELFEGYALHERMTSLLVERFGFEINVNGKCQHPCGRWEPVTQEGSGELVQSSSKEQVP